MRDTAQQIVEQQTPKRSGYNLHCNSILFDGYLPLNYAHKEKREITKKKQTKQNKKEKLASKYHYCDLKLLGIDKNFTNAVLIDALRKAR